MNTHYKKLQSSYLFSKIGKKVGDFQAANPDQRVIKLGIGDVTHALSESILSAFHKGVDDQGSDESFHGYGPEQGYAFLRDKIAEYDYRRNGCDISPDEIFVSDGAKCDTGNIQELFSQDISIGVPDPVYPVYVDTNVMAGRTGEFVDGRYEGLHYLEGNESNGFVPSPPDQHIDLIYLCFPNNPTGTVATREQLAEWVAYARREKSLILFDAAYVEFIRDESIPKSIYEIPGAREVAVEFRSYSKTAGFTGTRCAYTVIPSECMVYDEDGSPHSLKDLWLRRQSTKFNGVSYPVQKAAEAIYTEKGRQEVRALSDYYLENAKLIRNKMTGLGFTVYGGENSPYVWVKAGESSWELFDELLEKAAVVTTPGAGFGSCGEGFIRISSFNHRDQVEEALERIADAFASR
ncbi:LL-diaminopimelate aminotransferase [Salinispira pacifica]|uniref:LL-diaminopimelate aminotransferase n=1 Tax=Salinispira pacifica TaxID=1307761 RepID=V5WJI7_9SPIO|nr:L,L-diaminopimelate aminotransferase [Salinispira pacifica]